MVSLFFCLLSVFSESTPVVLAVSTILAHTRQIEPGRGGEGEVVRSIIKIIARILVVELEDE